MSIKFQLCKMSNSRDLQYNALFIVKILQCVLKMREKVRSPGKCSYTKKTKQRDTRKLLEVMTVFITLTLVMVSQVCAYVQMRQILCIKYVQFLEHQLYPLKLLRKQKNMFMKKNPTKAENKNSKEEFRGYRTKHKIGLRISNTRQYKSI